MSAAIVVVLVGAVAAHADSTPVGPLPAGPVITTATKRGLLVSTALPRPAASSGLVWRVARRYDSRVVRQVGEADVGGAVVVVFKAVGRGKTAVVFALTRGEGSAKALKSLTYVVKVS